MYMLFWNLRCDNYSRETTIQGRKLLISKTFYCDKYSKETTIQGRKLFAEIRYLKKCTLALFPCLLNNTSQFSRKNLM